MPVDIMHIVSGPEFWLSVSFFAVLLLSVRPLSRYLKNWGAVRRAQIQSEIDETALLRQKAEDLLAEYREKTRNKSKERAAILKRAREEAAYLKTEANQKLQERLQKQDADLAVRLSLMKEQEQRDLKDKMLKNVMTQTTHLLTGSTRNDEKQTDAALDLFLKTLDEHTDLLMSKS